MLLQVFSSFPHMHVTGSAYATRIIRDGKELAPLDYSNFYDFDIQIQRDMGPEPRTIKPGQDSCKTKQCAIFGADRLSAAHSNFHLERNGIGCHCFSMLFVPGRRVSNDSLHDALLDALLMCRAGQGPACCLQSRPYGLINVFP